MPRNNNPEGHNQYTKRADNSSKQTPQDLSVSSRGMRQESDSQRSRQQDQDSEDSDRSSYRSDRS